MTNHKIINGVNAILLQVLNHFKRGRDGKSDQNKCNKKLLSAVVVNNRIYVSLSPPIYFSYDPIWVKNNVGTGIHNYDHSLQLH